MEKQSKEKLFRLNATPIHKAVQIVESGKMDSVQVSENIKVYKITFNNSNKTVIRIDIKEV